MNGDDIARRKKEVNGTSFLVTIVGHDNQNYQGVVEWLDTRKKIHFRSMYELWSLIEQAVQVNEGSRDPPRNWESESRYKIL